MEENQVEIVQVGVQKLGGFFCGFLVKQDCCSDEDILQQQSGEDALFCTLCNAEVQDFYWASLCQLSAMHLPSI